MATFATAEDLATYLQRDLSAEDTATAELLLGIVTSAIKTYTGQQIELVTNDVVKLHGTWARELVLPQRPVISVSSVKINGSTAAAGSWLLAGNTLYRGNLLVVNGPDWGSEPFMSSWLGPMSSVEVTYTHGFATIPDVIRGLCLEAAAELMEHPVGGVRAETTGPYTVQYADVQRTVETIGASRLDTFAPALVP